MENQLSLQPRLAAIAAAVPVGARLVDVGTDHGYLPIALLMEGKIQSAVATDIGKGPLDHARRSAALYEIPLTCRLCDGLAAVSPEEADTVVIAGMGGETILNILAAAPWTREHVTLLLQPMSKSEVLRRWLIGSGYTIVKEQLVEDKGHLYPILTVRGGEPPPYTPGMLWAGSAKDDPLYPAYVAERTAQLKRAYEGLQKSAAPDAHERLIEIRSILEELCGGVP